MPERDLLLQVAEITAETTNVAEVCASILALLRRVFLAEVACLWRTDYDAIVLHCSQVICALDAESSYTEFRQVCENVKLAPGEGGPGRVWMDRTSLSIENLAEQQSFPRRLVVSRTNLQSYFATPIMHDRTVFGVFEFFWNSLELPVQESLHQIEDVGRAIGIFLHKQNLEEAFTDSRRQTFTKLKTEAVITIDERSRIRYANSEACRIFGYSPAEFVGESLLALIPSELHARHLNGFARYLNTGTRNITWDGVHLGALHKSGKRIPVVISFGEISIGEQRLFSGFIREEAVESGPGSSGADARRPDDGDSENKPST